MTDDTKNKIDVSAILKRIPEEWGQYISCGVGWHQIIVDLDQKLAAIDPDYVVHQVKEKFGGLRYYCSLGLEAGSEDYELIAEAERQCSVTCEECSAPGTITGKGWITTLCEACFNQRNKK